MCADRGPQSPVSQHRERVTCDFRLTWLWKERCGERKWRIQKVIQNSKVRAEADRAVRRHPQTATLTPRHTKRKLSLTTPTTHDEFLLLYDARTHTQTHRHPGPQAGRQVVANNNSPCTVRNTTTTTTTSTCLAILPPFCLRKSSLLCVPPEA